MTLDSRGIGTQTCELSAILNKFLSSLHVTRCGKALKMLVMN